MTVKIVRKLKLFALVYLIGAFVAGSAFAAALTNDQIDQLNQIGAPSAVSSGRQTQLGTVLDGVVGPQGSTTVAADTLAIPLTARFVYKNTGSDAEACTLAAGVESQEITIQMLNDGGGDCTITPATTSGFATIVLADTGDMVTLVYVDSTVGWVVTGAAGVSAQPAMTQ